MSDSKKNFVLRFLLCFGAYHSVIGIQINLTRSQAGDYFNNPYATCDKVGDSDKKFCDATSSICYKKYPFKYSECCYCLCQVVRTTFGVGNSRCSPNQDFRSDCSLKLDVVYDEAFLYAIDLTKDGQRKITAENKLPSGTQFKLLSCSVRRVERMNSKGYEAVLGLSFGVKSVDNRKGFTMNWPKSDKENYGRVYRIWFNCQYKRPGHTNGIFDDCLMLKSSGTVQINHPGLPSGGKSCSELATSTATTTQPTIAITTPIITTTTTTTETATQINPTTPVLTTSRRNRLSSSHLHETIPTSTVKELINPSSILSFYSPTSTRWTRPTPSSIKDEVVEIFTPQTPSPTIDRRPNQEETSRYSSSKIDKEFPNSPKKEKRSSASNGKMIVYIVVVVMAVVAIIVLATLVRFTKIRKKKKALKKRESRVDIIMSDIKNDLNEEEDGYYTSLNKIPGNDESNYEPLNLRATNKNQTIRDAYNEKMRQNANESIYADVDRVYCTIDPQTDDRKIRARNNLAFDVNENERVYSIVKQEPGQIDYTTPSGEDNRERVYSILEEEPGKIAYPTPSIPGQVSADIECSVGTVEVYSTIEEIVDVSKLDSESNYVTVLPPEKHPSQSNCSLYADLSEQRDRNEYQSLVKRKK